MRSRTIYYFIKRRFTGEYIVGMPLLRIGKLPMGVRPMVCEHEDEDKALLMFQRQMREAIRDERLTFRREY